MNSVRIGEGFAGAGPNAAHVNTVLGPREGPVGSAWTIALATPRAGHSSFVVVARPNMPVKPPTLFVNKAEIRGDRHGLLHWGAAQAGVARGVLECVAEGTIPQGEVDDLALIAAVWVDWSAADEEEVYANNVEATRAALASAAEGRPRLEDLLAIASEPTNPFFRRE
ncbi:MAG TPA: formaldehyde-activating enzyme [Gaiellaceae bacterium]|nr:formaldehyde-activating enzyme [Gaiellaceae bacterium]